jgi:hypothetical protein
MVGERTFVMQLTVSTWAAVQHRDRTLHFLGVNEPFCRVSCDLVAYGPVSQIEVVLIG